MQDFPELGRVAGDWTAEQAERGAALRLANKHLRSFSKWKKKQSWDGKTATLYTAQIYALQFGLPPRFAFIQTLCQLYEQKALGLVREYPPLLRNKRFTFFSSSKQERAPPTLS